MPIAYPAILDLGARAQSIAYTARDSLLYALAIGMGAELAVADQPNFVYEKNQQVLPSFASTIAWHAGLSIAELGLDYTRVVHAAEEIILHRPLLPSAQLLVDTAIEAAYDRGRDKGAIIIRRAELRDAATSQPIATVRKTLLARGDGGFGGPAPIDERALMPQRTADVSIDIATRPDQALLYRLCGDRNSLHVDPVVARAAGFDAPILHGLCTYGISCRALLRAYPGVAPAQIYSHSARLAGPVYPGDLLTFQLWRDGSMIFFEAHVTARNVQVLANGKTVLRSND